MHFFWGGFDLAVTRFSGRPAPPREGPAFMREAYSHEVISHGFWPGNDAMPEPVFYAYAVPEPDGFKEAARAAAGGAAITPISASSSFRTTPCRATAIPMARFVSFVESTYVQAATLAGWDRAALERTP